MPRALSSRPARRMGVEGRRYARAHRRRRAECAAGAHQPLHGGELMDLILWRHAEAFEMREVDNDLDRALTPKGERQAQRMAEWLNQRLPPSTKNLGSPARRFPPTGEGVGR